MTGRLAAWTLFALVAAVRPGVDWVDQQLVARCWDVPSEWNAVADIAMRIGVVDARISGRRAPWRQASVLPVDGSRVAVVTVSDMFTSRATFITERYDVVGVLTRETSDPVLVTDEARGYKPLTHVWPLVRQDERLHSLIAFAPLRSDPPSLGFFAYVALGTEENELLFVCRLSSGPGSTFGELVRADINGDGLDDLAVYQRGPGGRPPRPMATFAWQRGSRSYAADVTDEGRPIVAWWSTTASERVMVPRNTPMDDAVRRVAARLDLRLGALRPAASAGEGRQKTAAERTFVMPAKSVIRSSS